MTSFAERLIAAIGEHPGATDRFLTNVLFGSGHYPAQVNQEARLLSQRGQIERRRRPDGRLGSFPSGRPEQSERTAQTAEPDSQLEKEDGRTEADRQDCSTEPGGDVSFTPREQEYCAEIAHRIDRLRTRLNERTVEKDAEPAVWYDFLSALKEIQGNTSNDISFIATLLAKRYLIEGHGIHFCAAEKPQGAPGIDIDVKTKDGARIVAEIKTTMPYQGVDFGAQQAAMFKKDFAKLVLAEAKYKYLFVTEAAAFEVLKKPKYSRLMPGVRVVLLKTNERFDA
jgi:hypothetical protein